MPPSASRSLSSTCSSATSRGNTQRVIEPSAEARDRLKADLVLFPELSLCGYPPEDLLFHKGMRRQVAAALERVRSETSGIAVMVGYPEYADDGIYNAAALIRDGEALANYRKQELPNYSVFDEKRYFKPGQESLRRRDERHPRRAADLRGRLGAGARARRAGRRRAAASSSSTARRIRCSYQATSRRRRARRVSSDTGLPVVYVNLLGGQDELVFDGGSFVMNAAGEVVQRAPPFEEELYAVDIDLVDGKAVPRPGSHRAGVVRGSERLQRARARRARLRRASIASPASCSDLSGGIDSALTLAIAVDALGADRVHAVMMPSRYTSQMSLDDAAAAGANARRALRRDFDRRHVRSGARRAEGRVRRARSRTRRKRTSRRAAAACC